MVVTLTSFKDTIRLNDSKFKIENILTLENMVFVEENKQVLAAMNHKGFKGIATAMERANTGAQIKSPKECTR